MKIMVGGVPPLAGAGAVFTVGGVVLLIAGRSGRRLARAQVSRAATTGLLLLAGGQGLATVVLTRLTASLSAVLLASVPLWIAVLAARAGYARARVVWLLIGFAGVVMVLVTAPAAEVSGSPLAVGGPHR